jgi:tetratricopeptide (TPR) repeat protein
MHRLKIVVLLALLILPFCSSAAESVESLFTTANKAYAAKKYEAAALNYQKVLDAGLTTSAIYYNLGNAQYRLNNFAAAILNYERAHRLAPNDRDINVNLILANSKITDKTEVVPELFFKRWWNSFLLLLTVQSWSVVGVSMLLIGFGGLISYLFSRELLVKRLSFYLGLSLIFIGICFISFANAQENYLLSHKEAIVFNGTVHVKSAPAVNQKTLMIIHEGTKVKVLDAKNDWLKVELPNGNEGWVEGAALQLI